MQYGNTQMEMCIIYSSFTSVGGDLGRKPKAGHRKKNHFTLCSQSTDLTPGTGKLLCLLIFSILPDLFQEWFWY